MKIKIERLSDTHDCETCGPSWADGARVYFDGEVALELEPHAYCYDGDDYSDDKIFAAILERLGHTLTYADVD